jgi:hypothetical protein
LEESLSRHLDAVSRRMGRFLRGFDDPRVHTGSVASFVAEFRRILDLATLRRPGEEHPISYAAATATCKTHSAAIAGTESSDPVSAMIQGLEAPSLHSPDLRRQIPLEMLQEDIMGLLRMPALRFYIAISDRHAFFGRLDEIVKKGAFPLVKAESATAGGKAQCPFCHSQFQLESHSRLSQCGACWRPLECVRSMPMVSAVVATVSYEMLRRIVSMDLVESYQAEGKIVPLGNGS